MCCLLQLVTGGQGRDDGGHLVMCICSSCVVCVCVCVCVCVREGERESVCMWVHAFVMKWVYPYVFVSPLGSYKMGCHKLLWLHWGWDVPYLAGLWVGMGCCIYICDLNQTWIRTLMSLVASIYLWFEPDLNQNFDVTCCIYISDLNQTWIRTLVSLVASTSVIWARLQSELWCHSMHLYLWFEPDLNQNFDVIITLTLLFHTTVLWFIWQMMSRGKQVTHSLTPELRWLCLAPVWHFSIAKWKQCKRPLRQNERLRGGSCMCPSMHACVCVLNSLCSNACVKTYASFCAVNMCIVAWKFFYVRCQ